MEKFDLYVLIGKSRIKLLYSQNSKDLRCFDYNGKSYTPFYFYSDNSSSIIGENAKTKFYNGDQNAYGDYFELIKAKKSTFNFYGADQNIKLIIVRTIEKLIDEFLNEIIFSSKNVYELKDKINLNLIYYSDINENEINLVNDLFKKEGFSKIEAYNYNFLLLNHLDLNRKIGSFKGYIISDSIDGNLHLSFYDKLGSSTYKTKEEGKGIAINPMINIIGDRLVGHAIEKRGFNLNVKNEIDLHKDLFAEVVEKLKTKKEFYQSIKLSNGITERVKIKLSQINSTLMTQSHFTKDFGYIQQFHQKTNLQQSDVIFILHGDVHSDQYSDKIKSNFAHVHISKEPSTEIFQLFYLNESSVQNGNLNRQLNTSTSKTTRPKVKSKPVELDVPKIKQITEVPKKMDQPDQTKLKTKFPLPPPPPPRPRSAPPRPPRVPRKPTASKNINQTTSLSTKPKNIKKKNDVSVKKIVNLSPPPLPGKKAQNSSIKTKKNIRRPSVPPPPPMPKK